MTGKSGPLPPADEKCASPVNPASAGACRAGIDPAQARRAGYRRCPRIAYISGPIDAARVYDDWQSGTTPDYYGTVYLLDFYRIVRDLGADALVVTTLPGAHFALARDGIAIVNHPLPESASGVAYHVAMLVWAIRCILTVVSFRAHAVLLTAGQDYFWPFAILRLAGTRLLVSLHCTLWPKFVARKGHQKILDWLNGRLLYPACDHIQANSHEALCQVRRISPALSAPTVQYMATYQPDRFARARPTGLPSGRDPFRLLYVGRIAVNKGVLDAVRVMRILEDRHPGRYVLAMCGSGPDEDRLAAAVERTGLGGVVTLEGECPADRLHAAYAGCHAVLVPTRSDFEEGQPKVAFEAVLNYRPLVMSAACPALNDVGVATIEARVDDVEDYVSAIERLSQDRDLYARTVDGTRAVRGTFLEPRNGYHAALQKALERVALRERS